MARTKGNGANLGFEDKLWEMADKLRGHMDAAEYKHVVLGLIFLKYISDAFQEKYEELKAKQETEYTDAEHDFRDRQKDTLFIDAKRMERLVGIC